MNETPNSLIQLGEALGPVASLVILLLLCGGAVWVAMSVRRNKDDLDRLEAKIDKGFGRLETKLELWRKEFREDSKETREIVRAINSRLNRIVDGTPSDQPG